MKKNILASVSLLALLVACNDDYSDQFNIDNTITDVKNINMTLTSADYSNIAGNATNKEIALAKDPEGATGVAALEAVGKQKYFTADASAEDYLPAFLLAKYPNADNGSKFVVTYDQYRVPSAYLADFKSLSSYQLTADDYKTVWGDAVKASFLSPASIGKIPTLLKENVANAVAGDMVAVNYAYSEVEPSIGGGSSEEISYTPISEVIANVGGGDYTVKGEVLATYARGFLVSDGTASILVYLNATANYSVGDVVSIAGTTSKYSGLMQFSNELDIELIERKTSFAFPTPVAMTGADLDAYMSAPSIKYVTYKGKLSISGNYYNIIVEGATRQGSISYPVSGVVDAGLNGKEIEVTGYLIGGSTKFVNMMVTSVVEANVANEYTPVGVVALSESGNYKVKGVVAATYARGFLLTDGTGNVLVYLNGAHEYKQGDVVTVSGKTSKYSGLMQFPQSSEVVKVADGTFKLPAVRALSVEDMESYLTAPYVGYVTYEGTLSISGNYYNVIIDGSSAVQGSLSYPNDGLVDASLNGQKVIVTGYAIGVSSGKYLNTMTLSVESAASASKANLLSAVTRAAAVSTNASALYRYDGAAWSLYTTADAKVAVVEPAVYASLGTSFIAEPDEVLPVYLNSEYPYAAVGDRVVAVYKSSSTAMAASEYTKSEAGWIETPETVQEIITLSKDVDGISAKISVYMDESFLGVEGGMVAQDVSLTGNLSYVWRNQTNYGWTASSYLSSTATNYAAESWLVTPALDFTKGVQPIMTYDEAVNFANGKRDEFCTVKVSIDYKNDVTKATWTDITSRLQQRGDGASWTFANVGDIDLSDFVGHSVRIAFVFMVPEGASSPTWEIKNLLIKEADAAE